MAPPLREPVSRIAGKRHLQVDPVRDLGYRKRLDLRRACNTLRQAESNGKIRQVGRCGHHNGLCDAVIA